jgi:hypothetical protein
VGGGCGAPVDRNARQGGEGEEARGKEGGGGRTSRRGWSPWSWDSLASANSPIHGQPKVRLVLLRPTRRPIPPCCRRTSPRHVEVHPVTAGVRRCDARGHLACPAPRAALLLLPWDADTSKTYLLSRTLLLLFLL